MKIRIFFWGAVLSLLGVISLMVVVAKVNAQSTTWGSCTNGICYTGGRVGVGLLTPATTLDISGNVKSTANSGGATFVVAPGGGGQNYGMTAVGGAGGLYLGRTTGPGGPVSPDLFMTGTGKVGVNTVSPVANFDINGSLRSISNSGGATNVISPNGAGKSYGMAVINGNSLIVGEATGPGGGIGAPKFRIYDNGDVCIGSCQ